MKLPRIKISQDFPKPFKKFEENFSVNVDLSNYATKIHLKNITYVDTSNFALKTNLPTIIHKIF